MNTAVINVKTTPETKKKAHQVAEELGFSLSSLVNAFLKQLIKTKSVSFSASDEEPTEYLIQALKESQEDVEKGRVSPAFDNAKDARAWLDNPKRKYANQVRKKVR